MDQRADRLLDKLRLVKYDAGCELPGHIEKVRGHLPHGIHNCNRIGIASLFHDREINGRLSVHADHIRLDRVGVSSGADVSDRHVGTADRLERNAVDVGHMLDLAVGVNIVVIRPDLGVARRQDQVGVVHGANHIHHAEPVRPELERIDVDHDLAVLAAERRRYRSPRGRGNLVSNSELAEIAELSFGQALTLQSNQANRQAGRVKFHNDGRERSGRQSPKVRHCQVRNLVHIRIGARSRLKVDLNDAGARK